MLAGVAYPSVVWLPDFVERFRITHHGLPSLLPAHYLFARHCGSLVAFSSAGLFVAFLASAACTELRSPLAIKLVSIWTILLLSFFSLLLMACLAGAE
jgi:hypothetical protein